MESWAGARMGRHCCSGARWQCLRLAPVRGAAAGSAGASSLQWCHSHLVLVRNGAPLGWEARRPAGHCCGFSWLLSLVSPFGGWLGSCHLAQLGTAPAPLAGRPAAGQARHARRVPRPEPHAHPQLLGCRPARPLSSLCSPWPPGCGARPAPGPSRQPSGRLSPEATKRHFSWFSWRIDLGAVASPAGTACIRQNWGV